MDEEYINSENDPTEVEEITQMNDPTAVEKFVEDVVTKEEQVVTGIKPKMTEKQLWYNDSRIEKQLLKELKQDVEK